MSVGLRTWDDTGKPIVDLTTQFSRVLGSFKTGTGNGSIAVPETLPAGRVFFVQVADGTTGDKGKLAAVVYQGNRVFSWAFSYPGNVGNYSAPSTVYYGYF